MHATPAARVPPIERDEPVRSDEGAATATASADFEPVLPRFSWLKRIGVAVGLLVVTLGVLRGVGRFRFMLSPPTPTPGDSHNARISLRVAGQHPR